MRASNGAAGRFNRACLCPRLLASLGGPGSEYMSRRSYIAVAVASVGAFASYLMFSEQMPALNAHWRSGETLPNPAQASVPSFVQRFPEAAVFESAASLVELQLRSAKSRLALAMQTQPTALLDGDPSPPAASENVPLPKSRPSPSHLMADLGQVTIPAQVPDTADPLSQVGAALRKTFAMLQPSEHVVASAAPDGGISSDGADSSAPTLRERQAALYDISAHTVYMPDGTRLEAHSGLGELMDDPKSINVKDRGATPPQVYELAMREKPFHGVEALRMRPVGQGDLFGRNGLLTHSYMMGPNGDSNGCVSFKDYDAFLSKFKAGDVKRLIVVRSLADPIIRTAQRT